MKKNILLLGCFLLITLTYGQSPQSFKYQAVVRAADGGALANKIVGFKISILKGGASGVTVYTETQSLATNDFGVANVNVGMGSVVSGNFASINWGNDLYFIKVEIDINGGTNYQFMGSSQILSVPYALYAEKSKNAEDDYDKDSTNEIQIISKTGNTISLSKGGGSVTDNDNQLLSLNGGQLSITNGNSVQIGGTIDLDWDPTNELQTLSKHGDTIAISNGNKIALNIDTTNQLQQLTKVGDSIKLSKNGGSVFDSDNQQLSSSKNGQQVTVSISDGNSTTFNVKDNDADSTNELQTLSYANDTLSISKGNNVFLGSFNDLIFPDGFNGMISIIKDSLHTKPYVIPTGYNFYVNYLFQGTGGDTVSINNIPIMLIDNNSRQTLLPIIVGENSILKKYSNSGVINGFLVPKRISPFIIKIDNINTSYTVPINKTMIILNFYSSYADIKINGKTFTQGYWNFNNSSSRSLPMPIILKSGDIITYMNGSISINGYFK